MEDWDQYLITDDNNWEQYSIPDSNHNEENLTNKTGYQDILSGLAGIPGRMFEGIKSLSSLPKEAYGVLSNPSRIPQNTLVGFGKLGQKILNSPGNARDWAQSRGYVSGDFPSLRFSEEMFPRDYDYAKGVGLEGQQPGDALTQGLVSNAPSAIGATMGAAPLALVESLNAIGQNENPITAAGSSFLARKLGEIGKDSLVAAKDIYKASNKEKLGQRILEQGKKNATEATKLYDTVEKSVDNLNLGKIKVPIAPKQLKLLNKKLPGDTQEILHRYLKNPDFKNTRSLTSDLFKYDPKKLTKLDKLTYTHEAVKAANSLRSKLLDSLEKTLKSKGDKGVQAFDQLQKANTFYKNQKIPFDQRLFNQYKAKDLSLENLVKKLSKNDKFLLSNPGKQFSELKYVGVNPKDMLIESLKGSGAFGGGLLGTAAGSYLSKGKE